VTYDRDEGIITRANGEVLRLPPPPEFLREALNEGSILEYYKKYQKFPGE
jgi:methanogen homoaconitase small subunit